MFRPLTEVLPGVPTRNLIVTTFRSGSTFTSEIFGSHPGTFNYYEPLYKLEGYHTSILKKVIKNLLECNIPGNILFINLSIKICVLNSQNKL